jgi:hypothetical protein
MVSPRGDIEPLLDDVLMARPYRIPPKAHTISDRRVRVQYLGIATQALVGVSGREMTSNVELLTHAHQVVRAKKRQKLGQIKTVVFDEDARRCAHSSISIILQDP